MDVGLCKAMRTFSLDFSDDDKYPKSTTFDLKKISYKVKNRPFRRGSGMKSPVTMHSTGRACDILITQFGRGVEGMGPNNKRSGEVITQN